MTKRDSQIQEFDNRVAVAKPTEKRGRDAAGTETGSSVAPAAFSRGCTVPRRNGVTWKEKRTSAEGVVPLGIRGERGGRPAMGGSWVFRPTDAERVRALVTIRRAINTKNRDRPAS